MKKLTIPALAFIVVQHTAFAFPVTEAGPSLGLGRGDSPTFAGSARFRQAVIARLFGSSTSFGFTPNTKISVDADSVVCRVSNVDITSRGCDLSFGSRKRTLTGREANELGATTAVAGVPSQEAAGSSTESISNCGTIDPKIMRRAEVRIVWRRRSRCLCRI